MASSISRSNEYDSRQARDQAKYELAVALASAENSGMPDETADFWTRVSWDPKKDLKDRIDRYYSLMSPEMYGDGGTIRGRGDTFNPLEMLHGGLNVINNSIGMGLDAGVDAFGGLVGSIAGDESITDDIKNATTMYDLAAVPDIAETIALGAVNPWLGAAKGLLDSSDNLGALASGRDEITGQRLDAGQQLGNFGSAAFNIALGALPGAGVAKGAAKTEARAAYNAAEKAGKAYKDANAAYKTAAETAKVDTEIIPKLEASRAEKEALLKEFGVYDTEQAKAIKEELNSMAKDLNKGLKRGSKDKITVKANDEVAKLEQLDKDIAGYEKELSKIAAEEEKVIAARTAYQEALANARRVPKADSAWSSAFSRTRTPAARYRDTGLPTMGERTAAWSKGTGREKLGNFLRGGTKEEIKKADLQTAEQALRDREVLRLRKAGKTDKEIEEALTKSFARGDKNEAVGELAKRADRGLTVGNRSGGPNAFVGNLLAYGSVPFQNLANGNTGTDIFTGGMSEDQGSFGLFPLAMANIVPMMPGARKALLRMGHGNTLPYYATRGFGTNYAMRRMNDQSVVPGLSGSNSVFVDALLNGSSLNDARAQAAAYGKKDEKKDSKEESKEK